MALKKITALPNGFDAEYIRIMRYVDHREEHVCEVQLGIYKDQDARQAGKVPAAFPDSISLNADNYPGTSAGMALADIYTKLKTLQAFADAVNV